MLKPTYEVDRLVRILACLANNRTGIPFNEWVQLVSQVLKISSTSIVHQVSRAWMESGLIDVASFARWRQRMVFARRPHLIAFRKPSYIDVCVSGLSLPSTRQLVLERAAVLGIPTSDRLSVSPYVPAMPVARAGSDDAVISLSRDTGLPLAWLDCGPDSLARMGKHRGLSPPPVHYEASFSVTRWSLSGDVGNADVSVRRYVRRDKPDYWLVEQDQRRLWFYDMNVTRGWAAALLGQPLVTKRGDTSLTAVHGYLPLPLARAVNLAGVGLAGPAGDGSYEYPIGLKRLCDRVIASLNHVYTIHPHAAGEPSQG
jgi:hypothetical protein